MTTRQTPEVLIARDEIVAPPAPKACHDQSFELPNALYVAMALMFAGFVTVLGLAFHGGHMPVVLGVIFAFLAAFFVIPSLFPRMAPDGAKALTRLEFGYTGIWTATGRSPAFQATILVLLLPFLVLCFAIAVATIAAFV